MYFAGFLSRYPTIPTVARKTKEVMRIRVCSVHRERVSSRTEAGLARNGCVHQQEPQVLFFGLQSEAYSAPDLASFTYFLLTAVGSLLCA